MNKHIIAGFLFLNCFLSGFSQNARADESSIKDDGSIEKSSPVSSDLVLDRGLKPKGGDEISSMFENIVAVQRKSKVKSGKILFNPSMSFDFSDSPRTMYGVNLSLGYAIGEFWEIYLTTTPLYSSQERSLAKKVRDLQLPDGQKANILSQEAKSAIGFDVNWVPIYGKDSWGPYGIIRSDTFLNLGYSNIQYESATGMAIRSLIGKTFFISNLFNLRLAAGGSILEVVSTNDQKDVVVVGLLAGGLVYYF